MRRKAILLVVALLAAGATSLYAQKDDTGKTVKRVTFDREQVTITYADGAKSGPVQKARIVSDLTTAVKTLRQQPSSSARTWYAADGRRLQAAPAGAKKGVFVVRDGNKVRKIVKK